MAELTRYDLSDGVATITLDDGKVNALSPAMLGELSGRLDQAESDEAIVILTGRERILSAGFDLKTEGDRWPEMLEAGAKAAERMLTFPRPIVVACPGNAIAMGAFLLLSGDERIGVRGDFKIGLNEVAIGLPLPYFGIALARHRLTPPAFDRCSVTGTLLNPDQAVEAGFLDTLVDPDELESAARARAAELAGINLQAHATTKSRIRARMLEDLRDGIARISDPDRDI